MARQQSNTELAGSLAATLTPRVPRASAQSLPDRQNSGLFDVGALYAEALDEVLRRTRSDARLLPLARAAQPTWPRAAGWPLPVLHPAFEAEVPIEFTDYSAAPRPRGLGWFGIAVAWLATVTTGALIATTLPGHAMTHTHAASLLAVAVNPPQPQAAIAPAVIAAPLAVAPPLLPPVAPADAPATQAAPVTQAMQAVAAAKKAAPKIAGPAIVHVHPAATATVARPTPSTPTVAPSAPAIAVAPRAAPPSRPAPVAATSTAGMSLDDLIRHEVQAESAKHH
jgi:hypothetical protein